MDGKGKAITWKNCFRVGATAFLLFLCIYYWSAVAGFLNALFHAILPIFLGGAIAYIINILMAFYERHFFPRRNGKVISRIRRPACLIGAIVTIVAVVALVIGLVVPELVSCVETLIKKALEAINTLRSNPAVASLLPGDLAETLSGFDWESAISKVAEVLKHGLTGAANTVTSLVSSIVSGVLGIVFSIYILFRKDWLRRQGCRLMENYLRPSWKDRIIRTLSLLDQCFHKYIVGQCLEALILGGLCALGMTIFRFPYALMIGALVGLTALIPVAGAYIGAGVGAIMILSESPVKALLFLIFIIILQQLEGNLIYPKVVGSSTGLPSILVLAAVVVGGALFGILGILVSVPLTAAIYCALRGDMMKRETAALEKSKED